jgi:hypothetical protein
VGWSPAQLSQLGVFSFGFLKDGDVGVGAGNGLPLTNKHLSRRNRLKYAEVASGLSF